MQNSFRSWIGKEAGKAVVRYSSWRDKMAFNVQVRWHPWKQKNFWRPAMVCWGRKSRNLPQSMLWRSSWGGSPLLFKKIKLLLMGQKYFPGFQLFNKGHLWSCTPLKELSQKLCESVYMSWFQLCHLDMFKTTPWKGVHSLILTFHWKAVLIIIVQSNHYFARVLTMCKGYKSWSFNFFMKCILQKNSMSTKFSTESVIC